MGSPLNARQSDSAGAVHGVRRSARSSSRIHQKITEDAEGRSRSGQATAMLPQEAALNPAHLGSDFEDFLKEEGLFESVHALAVKKVVAYKLLELLRQKHLTKDALAKRMKTSRAQLDRLLDPNNLSVTLSTLSKAASALGCTLRVELTP